MNGNRARILFGTPVIIFDFDLLVVICDGSYNC